MKLTLDCKRRHLPFETRAMIERLFRFTVDHLGISNYAAEVCVTVLPERVAMKNLGHGTFMASGELGGCSPDMRGSTVDVVLFPPCEASIPWTLAHELTHAAQMLRGDLRGAGEGRTWWRGQEYRRPRSVTEYEANPWEIEARATEKIVTKFLEAENRRNR